MNERNIRPERRLDHRSTFLRFFKVGNTQGFHALIGRDILSQCGFVYNGSGFFTLAN